MSQKLIATTHIDTALADTATHTQPTPATPSKTTLAPTNPYIQAATAPNTRRAYRQDIQHFEQNGGLLPTTPDGIMAYLQQWADTLNPRTLSRRLTALKHWHVYQGFSDPTIDPSVRKMLKGITHCHGEPRQKAPAMTPSQLTQLIQYLRMQNTLTAHRDSALLQLAFFGAFRRSEIVKIELHHIQRTEEGLMLLIPRSKTDQAGEGQHCAIPYGDPALCPIRALDAWLIKANISEGPIFRAIDRWGHLSTKSLSPLALSQIIKKHAIACQLPNASAFSSHSLRRGLATSASQLGASLKAIMQQGRWQHVGTVLGYIEEGQAFNDNAAATVLSQREIIEEQNSSWQNNPSD